MTTTNKTTQIPAYTPARYVAFPILRGGLGRSFIPQNSLLAGAGINPIQTIKCVFNGTGPPTVNDDVTAKFSVGSRWIDQVDHNEYICISNTAGNAIWEETTGGGGVGSLPTSVVWQAAGSATSGYVVGDDSVLTAYLSANPTVNIVYVDSSQGPLQILGALNLQNICSLVGSTGINASYYPIIEFNGSGVIQNPYKLENLALGGQGQNVIVSYSLSNNSSIASVITNVFYIGGMSVDINGGGSANISFELNNVIMPEGSDVLTITVGTGVSAFFITSGLTSIGSLDYVNFFGGGGSVSVVPHYSTLPYNNQTGLTTYQIINDYSRADIIKTNSNNGFVTQSQQNYSLITSVDDVLTKLVNMTSYIFDSWTGNAYQISYSPATPTTPSSPSVTRTLNISGFFTSPNDLIYAKSNAPASINIIVNWVITINVSSITTPTNVTMILNSDGSIDPVNTTPNVTLTNTDTPTQLTGQIIITTWTTGNLYLKLQTNNAITFAVTDSSVMIKVLGY